jgi:hypothetical protein
LEVIMRWTRTTTAVLLFVSALVVSSLSALTLAGCGSKESSGSSEQAAPAERQPGATAQGAEGQPQAGQLPAGQTPVQTGEKVKVDGGARQDVDLSGLPVEVRYPGAVPIGHSSGAGPGGNGEMYVFQTNDSKPAVTDYFKTSLAGWRLAEMTENAKMSMVSYGSPDGHMLVTIVVGGDRAGGKTSINVTVNRK